MIARCYKTAKGTELPLLNLRGKQYLEVKFRLVWFREDHPDWSIETELISVTDVSAYARATIRDETGRVIATSHKFESIQGFPDFIEKAETGAIGRALALIGYGTQFCADELDEGKRIVDSPVPPRTLRGGSGDVVRRVLSVPPGANPGENAEGETENAEEAVAQENKAATAFDPADYTVSFGRKYKGKKLREIPRKELESYLQWLEGNAANEGTSLSYQVKLLKTAFDRLYNPTTEEAGH